MLFQNRRTFDSSEVTFMMMTFKDQFFAIRKLRQIRELYPDATIVVRSDGMPCEYREVYDELRVRFYYCERLFLACNGAKLAHRVLGIFLKKHPARYMIKVDPDTIVSKRLNFLPAFDCHFGTIFLGKSIQGGCAGFTYDVVSRIHKSKLLLSNDFLNPEEGVLGDFGVYQKQLVRRKQFHNVTSLDWSYAICCAKLGIPLYDHPEVNCNWNWFEKYTPADFAFLHPDISTSRYLHFADRERDGRNLVSPWSHLHL